jgi:hypothetical protein
MTEKRWAEHSSTQSCQLLRSWFFCSLHNEMQEGHCIYTPSDRYLRFIGWTSRSNAERSREVKGRTSHLRGLASSIVAACSSQIKMLEVYWTDP